MTDVTANYLEQFKSEPWFVHIDQIRTDYVVIEDLSRFMAPKAPSLHPDHPDYRKFWSVASKRCIEGIWRYDNGGWRYMPGNLYFFGNYGIIQHTDEDKHTLDMRPYIVDYIWDYAYDSMCTKGFSGFEKDTVYSSHLELQAHLQGQIPIEEVPPECFHNNKLKTFLPPYDNISRLHSKNLGLPLYNNDTVNNIVLGTRGSTKSYWVAIGEIEYRFVFCGAKRYNKLFRENKLKTETITGAPEISYSAEMLDKFAYSQKCKADNSNPDFIEWFGIWEEPAGLDKPPIVRPGPFHRKHKGNLDCPNKKNAYRHEYNKEVAGSWEARGTGSKVFHVSYSTSKPKAAQAGSGGRVDFSDVEEVGLSDIYLDIHGSNETTVARTGSRFGVQWSQGTSGNLKFIWAARKVMLNPQDYAMLSFPNQFGNEGKNGRIGRFIPYYVTLFKHKDDNGNTDFQKAVDSINRHRAKLAESDDPKVIRDEQMNRPCYLREMWINPEGYYLPYDEAVERETQLMDRNLYKQLMTPVKLVWDPQSPRGVKATVIHDREPITEWPLPKNMKDPSGCVVIYEWPTPVKMPTSDGNIREIIPNDMYIIGHDPYVEEDIDRGGSLGVTYVWKNAKYASSTGSGNILVASYIGKPIEGLETYYNNQEKLVQMYGNPEFGIYYEKNRGEYCRSYYLRKKKLNLLAPTPQYSKGSSVKFKRVTSTGFLVGNLTVKKNQLKDVNDMLLEPFLMMEEDQAVEKPNIFRIPCLFFIKQCQQFDLKENFDGVDAFVGCVIGANEYAAMVEATNKDQEQPGKTNTFAALLKNPKYFRNDQVKNFRKGQDG